MMMMMQMKAQFTEEFTEQEESALILFARKLRDAQENSLIIPAKKELLKFLQRRKLFSHFLIPNKGENFRYIISLRGLNGSHGG